MRDLAGMREAAQHCAVELATARTALTSLESTSAARVQDYRAQLRVLASDVQVIVEIVLASSVAAGQEAVRTAEVP